MVSPVMLHLLAVTKSVPDEMARSAGTLEA